MQYTEVKEKLSSPTDSFSFVLPLLSAQRTVLVPTKAQKFTCEFCSLSAIIKPLSCWKKKKKKKIDFRHSSFRRDLGFTQCSRGITLTDIVSRRSWTKYHTQLYSRDLFLYLSWLSIAARNWGESLWVGGGRFLGLSESVPHHLVPCGMFLRDFTH